MMMMNDVEARRIKIIIINKKKEEEEEKEEKAKGTDRPTKYK